MLSPIDEIKNRLDIIEVIGSYIKLQKTGANFMAPCPFHSEKKPSFFVSPARQIWHCFGGCSEGGDIFKFVMKIEGLEFGDALRILAQKAGVELKKEDIKLKTERQKLLEISELAAKFFEKQLESSRGGKEAKKYLLKRSLNEESLKKWRIGYAPDAWQGLSDFLIGRGYERESIVKAGLAIKSDKTVNNYYDRFRERIMFPIFDLNSQVIGFGGRAFGKKITEHTAKYMNTPNTLLYDKSRVLYGLDKAKIEIRKKNFCILVEGYVDTIMGSQTEFWGVVATSGTALTPLQLTLLKRYSDNILIAFDMDFAGDLATKRGIELAQNHGFNIKIITLPEEKDPADVISQNVKNWENLVKKAQTILEFYFATTFSRFDCKNPDGKREIGNVLLPIIKRIQNKIEQAYWIQELAKKIEIKEENIIEELKRIKSETQGLVFSTTSGPPSVNFVKQKSRKEMLEERIIALALKFPETINSINEGCFPYFSSKTQAILTDLKGNIPLAILTRANGGGALDHFSFKAEIEEEDEINPEEEIQACLQGLRFSEIKNQLNEVSIEIKRAEEKRDLEKINDLRKKFNELTKDLACTG